MAPEFEWRILYATGALIRRDGSVALGIAYKEGKNGERLYYERYSNASFKFWKQYSVSRPEMINKSMIDSAKQSLESILKAAATKGHTPGMKFQFGAVVASYELWVKRTVKEFRLKNRLQTENVPPKK
jgi:hypothetical protein